MFEQYTNVVLLLNSLVLMIFIQAIIASVAHRKQQSYIPGIVDAQLDHHSFVFRSHRTFMNSLENVPVFILTVLIGMTAAVESTTLFWLALTFTVARIIHMLLFYVIATNNNPSPRSYFYLIGLIAQISLIILIFTQL